jgi:Tol biopolymer transport system component
MLAWTLLLAVVPVASTAQLLDHVGTEFIFGFMPNRDDEGPVSLALVITSDTPADVTVQYPVNTPTFTTTVSITPTAPATIGLPVEAHNSWSGVSNNAVRVSATEPVSVVLEVSGFASNDRALALPVESLGTEYIVMSKVDGQTLGSQFVVVATQDGTTVQINGGSATALNRGQGFLTNSNVSLAGTIVTANKPVAVANGNKCASVPTGVNYCEHLLEVAVPVSRWGTEVLARDAPEEVGGTRRTVYRILAAQDSTQVMRNGVALGLLNRGSVLELISTAVANHFTASGPIQVVQYMNSLCDEYPTSEACPSNPNGFPTTGESGDASMVNVPATNQHLRRTRFVGGEWVNLVARTADVTAGLVHLDGVPVPANSFDPFATAPAWSHAQLAVSAGSVHTIESLQGHGITLHLLGFFSAQTWPAGIQFEPVPGAPAIAVSPPSLARLVAAGGTLPDESVTVRNAGGDVLTYAIADDAPWLSVSPTTGTSAGETDTLTLSYATAGLAPGVHVATLTVSGVATNTPRTIQVTVTVDALTIASGPSGTPNPVASGGAVSVVVSALDALGHAVAYAWSASCPELGGNGTFSDATLPTPTWTAPVNATGAARSCTLSVTASDGQGLSQHASYLQTVAAATEPPPPPATPTVTVLRRLSDGIGGAPAGGVSVNPSVSADGRLVVFESTARNLVASGCTDGESHVFLRDRATGRTRCISIAPNGAPGNGPSTRPAISGDGRVVAFVSAARNLVAAGCRLGIAYIFVRHLETEVTSCVSVGPGSVPADAPSAAPAISADGMRIAFASPATTLGDGCPGGVAQVFVHDRATGSTSCVSVGVGGEQGDGTSGAPTLSADGQVVAFESLAVNLVRAGCTLGGMFQVFVRDLVAGTTGCASVTPLGSAGAGASRAPALSADGRVVAFASAAIDLAAPCTTGIPQVFVRSLLLALTRCISVSPTGEPGNGPSADPAISADGRTVVFSSQATNLGEAGAAAAAGQARQLPNSSRNVVRWRDAVEVRDAVTVLVSGTGGGSGARPVAISADASVVVSEVQTEAGPGVAAVEELPAPPTGQPLIVAPAPGTAFTLLGSIPLTFAWTPVADAVGYRLVFAGAASVTLDVPPTPTFPVTLTPDIPPGGYQLVVVPLGAGGTTGTPSDPLAFSLLPGILLQADDRPYFTTPETEATVTPGQAFTLAWTAMAEVVAFGVEFTGRDRVFANPNGTAPDEVNGFGGAGGGFLVEGTSVTVVVPAVPPGRYQLRVIGIGRTGLPVGSFTDAVTVVVQ